MENTQQANGNQVFHFLYKIEHLTYDLSTSYSLRVTQDSTILEFKQSSLRQVDLGAIVGVIDSSYKLESQPENRVKVTWNSNFCDRCSKIFISDLVEESDFTSKTLHNSYALLKTRK